MPKLTLTRDQRLTVLRALTTAINAHKGHAKVLDQCAKSGGNDMITPRAATVMALDHLDMAQEIEELVPGFSTAEEIVLEIGGAM